MKIDIIHNEINKFWCTVMYMLPTYYIDTFYWVTFRIVLLKKWFNIAFKFNIGIYYNQYNTPDEWIIYPPLND